VETGAKRSHSGIFDFQAGRVSNSPTRAQQARAETGRAGPAYMRTAEAKPQALLGVKWSGKTFTAAHITKNDYA
jgi:hypothetical protein